MSRPPVISILIVVQKHCTYHYHQYSNSLARTTYHSIEIMAVDNDSDFTNLKTPNHNYTGKLFSTDRRLGLC